MIVALLWTVGLALAVTLAGELPMPGVSARELPLGQGALSPFALGVMPYLSAYGLVELAALAVPRWRGLRRLGPTGGLAGRRRLNRAALWLGLALAVVQAWAMMRFVDSTSRWGRGGWVEPWGVSRWVGWTTWVAGFALLWFVVRLASVRGLVNGFLLVSALTLRHSVEITLRGGMDVSDPGLGPALRALILVALVVYLVVRVWPRVLPRGVPASTIAPPYVASQLLLLPVQFAGALGLAGLSWLTAMDARYQAAHLALTLAATVGLTRLFVGAHGWLQPAKEAALLFVALAALDSGLRAWTHLALPRTLELVFVVTLIRDAVEDARARRLGPWVTVAVSTRAVDLEAYLAQLAPVLGAPGPRLRGRWLGQLLRFFAPHAPVEVQVPLRDLAAARAELEKVR